MGDSIADALASFVGKVEVNARIDPAAAGLIGSGTEIGEVAVDAGEADAVGGKRDGAKQLGEHRGGGGAEGGVPRDVLRMVGGDEQGLPGGIRSGVRVAIKISLADGGDRPPGVIGVFGIPSGNAGVSESDVENRQQTGGRAEEDVPGGGQVVGNVVPVARRRICTAAIGPESGDGGLLWGAGAGAG